MIPTPDPSTIDWNAIALWAGGAATVVVSIGVAIWKGISNATKVAATLPATVEKTSFYTADSVAMQHLAATVEASNVILTENNVLRREEIAERQTLREALEANTKATERVIDVLGDARVEIRELTREIARSGK